MTKLAISFITYNRPQHIQEYLKMIVTETRSHSIDIYISDTSDNNKTEEIVSRYCAMGFTHIHYTRYSTDYPFYRKIYNALMVPDTDYVWLCGDKFLIKPQVYDLLMSCIDKEYEIITMYGIGDGVKIYKNPVDFLGDTAWHMTHMGSTIIKKELISKFTCDWFENVNYRSFPHVRLYANAINKSQLKAIFLHINSKTFSKASRYLTVSESINQMWEIWIKNWAENIWELPARYNRVKPYILKSVGKQMGWFTFKGTLNLRGNGQLTIKKCIHYNKYISKVFSTSVFNVYLIAILPKRVAQILLMFAGGIEDEEK